MPADEWPSTSALSRRTYLAGSALGIAALTGCSAQANSSTPECATTVGEHGAGDILQQAIAMRHNGSIQILVSLQQPGDELPIERLVFRHDDGSVQERRTTAARENRQGIGAAPQQGRLMIRAEGQHQNPLDSITVDNDCRTEHRH